MKVAGLFSGVGGLELGMTRAGFQTELLCESWAPAGATLARHFAAPVVGDIRGVAALPDVDVVTAGFPCTDLSQVGRTAGIGGDESGLVREVFRLIERRPPTWLVLENVPNMLSLHGGGPIQSITDWLDEHGWDWAYRTVDSQHFGVPQRRRRVILVASQSEDPRTVLFADESSVPPAVGPHEAHGFYWTEGNRGVGWGDDVVPTLKGGSKLAIPSPPAVWRVAADAGNAIVRPLIEVGEQLQGFEPGWTDGSARLGERWKLVGNAVTVPVAHWVGGRLHDPADPIEAARPFVVGRRWPAAASSVAGTRQAWDLSEAPLNVQRLGIHELLAQRYEPLSLKATRGFYSRLLNSRLRAGGQSFKAALAAHIEVMASA